MPDHRIPSTEIRAKNGLIQSVAEVSQHVFQRRFGWMTLWLLLLSMPLCQVLPVAIVGNALLLDNYSQLLLLTTINVMALVFCVSLLRVMNSRFPTTGCLQWIGSFIGNGDSAWGKQQFLTVVISALVSPVIMAWLYSSEFAGVSAIVIGLVSLTVDQ